MDARPDDPLLAYARELEDADRALARAADEVEELRRETASVRGRAQEVEALLARLSTAREEAAEAVRVAARELDRRAEELRAAEAELAEAERGRDEERIAAARRAVVRSRDTASVVRGRVDRARSASEHVEREAERAREDAPLLERRARELAARLGSAPRVAAHAAEPPPEGLAGTVAWAARAEAALFVARSALDSERDRVVREANELGASVLGEPLSATSVALVRERLERR
jgi:DNA repair exonuclease SbcCD ATPase subunit